MAYYSYVNYTGDGDLTNFSITFPYLAKTHVKVYVQGILKNHNVHYTFLTTSVIQFSSAPLADELITIQRQSGRDARLVDYTTGSILKEETLDKDSNQLFYLMQEAFDAFSLATNEDGAVFTSPEAILAAITGSVDVEHLVSSLNRPIGYWDQIYSHDAIYEFNEDGTSVYDHGVLADEEARISLAENRIDAIVTDTEGHTGQLALMADEFYVKLDGDDQVCGFGLYNGETSSAFVVAADTFAVMATGGEGDPIIPFVIDTESGLVGISGNLLVTGSITAAKMAANSIEAASIKAGEIAASHISVGAVENTHISENAVKALQIDDLAVGKAHIELDAIDGTLITDSAISTEHVAANAITAGKILAGEIGANHMAALSIATGSLQVGSVTETIIGDGVISTQKLKVDAITASRIATGAVTADAVSTNEIIASAANIGNAVITGAKIANLTVDTLQIKGNAVTIPVSGYTAGLFETNTGPYTIQSCGITTNGSPVHIAATMRTAGTASYWVYLWRDTTEIYSAWYAPPAGYNACPIAFTDQPGAGSYTYKLVVTVTSGTQSFYNRSLVLLSVKK